MAIVYKQRILDKIWDKHGVEEGEIDEALTDPDLIRDGTPKSKTGNRRFLAIGSTKGNRILRIILEAEYSSDMQGLTLVTAFDAPQEPDK